MTKQHYETIIELLADKVKEQENKIAIQNVQLSILREELAKAEQYKTKADESKTLEIR